MFCRTVPFLLYSNCTVQSHSLADYLERMCPENLGMQLFLSVNKSFLTVYCRIRQLTPYWKIYLIDVFSYTFVDIFKDFISLVFKIWIRIWAHYCHWKQNRNTVDRYFEVPVNSVSVLFSMATASIFFTIFCFKYELGFLRLNWF